MELKLPYVPAMPFLSIYAKELKTGLQGDIRNCIFIAALFTLAKIWTQSKYPSADEWVKKMWDIVYTLTYIHTHRPSDAQWFPPYHGGYVLRHQVDPEILGSSEPYKYYVFFLYTHAYL